MKKLRKTAALLFTASLIAATVMTGCQEKNSAEGSDKGKKSAKSETVAPKKKGVFGDWNGAEELKQMQGTLKFRRATWTVEGNKVTITDGAKTKEATLDLSIPCKLKVTEEMAGGGTSSDIYGYARNGEDLYIGLGTTGMKVGDLYLIYKGGGVLVYDGTNANYYAEKRFGEKGFEEAVKVTASIEDKTITFEIPDRYKKGELKQYKVEIVGTALLNDQAKGNLITK